MKVGSETADFRSSAELQKDLQSGKLGADYIFLYVLLIGERHHEGLV